MQVNHCSSLTILLSLFCLSGNFARGEERSAKPEKSPIENAAGDRDSAKNTDTPKLLEGTTRSSYDQTEQPFRYWIPHTPQDGPRPLLVFLHSWSGNYRQNNSVWLKQAAQRGWIFVHPNFRGANRNPLAGGSQAAQQDILDCIDWAIQNQNVDTSRIYLAGASGGGHMSMLMAGRHPERFSAVSAWVGIGDLADWYRFHTHQGQEGNYAKMVAAICGGPPGSSDQVDAQYRERSPLTWLSQVGDLPIDLAAGVHDGKQGSVPIRHTIRMFNAIAKTRGATPVSDDELQQLVANGSLRNPNPKDIAPDESYGRAIHLRRTAGNARVTIFEGGHEGIAKAACHWLEQQSRPTHQAKRP